jgi:hypothetical protein
MIMKQLRGGLLLTAALVWLCTMAPAAAQTQTAAHTGWEQQAEESLYLPHGMGSQLMTQEEWQQHQQQMQGMTVQQRDQYRQEWHKKMMDRAKKRGLSMPEMPAGHGMGGGEMGHGGGMGGGGY